LAAEIGLPTTFKPDTSISLNPKPIITNFHHPQRTTIYTYAFAFNCVLWIVYPCGGLPILFMDILKLMQNLRLDICFYVIEFYIMRVN
jgi:DHA1 family bicyclomycin/chloramphenicol resistance-like MFS transporter